MAYQIKIKDFTSGGAKKIKSSDVKFTMSADAMWFSDDATALVDEEVLNNSDLHWIVLESGSFFEMEFTADLQGRPSGRKLEMNCNEERRRLYSLITMYVHFKNIDTNMFTVIRKNMPIVNASLRGKNA